MSAARDFSFRVGQFGQFSVFGSGEATFNICSSSNWKDYLEFCFRRTGRVTEALWQIEKGDTIGFRGPYGNGYPMEAWEGRNLIFIGGGIAMPPIRCAVWYALENRAKYGDITDRLRRAHGGRPHLRRRNWRSGAGTSACGWSGASIRAEKRRSGRARWA